MFFKTLYCPLTIWIVSYIVTKSEAIVNGENALEGEFPFIVSLRNSSGDQNCGGTLITQRHVVTAAHCVYDEMTIFFDGTPTKVKPQDIQVIVGTLSTKQGAGDRYEVETFVVHPKYDIRATLFMVYDVAIIILKRDVSTLNVNPIPLSTRYPSDDTLATIAGWGYINYDPQVNATILQKLTVKVQNKSTCMAEWYKKDFPETIVPRQINTEHIFCALPVENGSGACVRDSGGPLVSDGELIGIVTAGYPCAQGVADLYTSIAGYRDFISNVITNQSLSTVSVRQNSNMKNITYRHRKSMANYRNLIKKHADIQPRTFILY